MREPIYRNRRTTEETAYKKAVNDLHDEIFGDFLNNLDIILGKSDNQIMSQSELGKQIGVDRTQINRWIIQRTPIKIEDVVIICDVLGLDIHRELNYLFNNNISSFYKKIIDLNYDSCYELEKYINYLLYEAGTIESPEESKEHKKIKEPIQYRECVDDVYSEIFSFFLANLKSMLGASPSYVMSQRDLAKILNVEHTWISKVVHKTTRIKIEDAVMICSAMGLDMRKEFPYLYKDLITPLERKYIYLSAVNREKVDDYINYLKFQDMNQDVQGRKPSIKDPRIVNASLNNNQKSFLKNASEQPINNTENKYMSLSEEKKHMVDIFMDFLLSQEKTDSTQEKGQEYIKRLNNQ